MMLDNMILANNPPFMRRRGARIDPRQLVLKPAGYIDMDDTGDLRTIEIQDIRSSAYQLYQTLDSEFQMTTAMTNSQKGM